MLLEVVFFSCDILLLYPDLVENRHKVGDFVLIWQLEAQ
ncbi:hypothetical protein PORCRE_1788 [Porphyromonas crevioricanis JCM 15906]|uniref:Uncharacterized protein n=1 Tax=Porphyromonas crevioricanis JCM 15906 TaxID=1305617 RepID=T1CIR4_9PORP|nr:hypothetical protein PORCRE_1788 [Porphyromonas crevioricanis JCM 15906]